MKAVSILITILMVTSIVQGAVSSNLVDEYVHQYKKLRSLLLSVEGNGESAEDIVRLQKN